MSTSNTESPPNDPDRPRHLFARYHLLRRLNGERVPEAWLVLSGRERLPAVLKMLPPDQRDPVSEARFDDELTTLRRLRGRPHVVQIVADGDDDGYLWFETVHAGETLAYMLSRVPQVPERIALRIARDVAVALDAAHRMTSSRGGPLLAVHRDVCPENILVDTSGYVSLCDFGAVCIRSKDAVTNPGFGPLGTSGYIAPEYLGGHHPMLRRRADVWSLGVVLWEMLAGRRLFPDQRASGWEPNVPSLASVGATVSDGVDALVRRLTAPLLQDRIGTAPHMLAAIDALSIATPEELAHFVAAFAPPPHEITGPADLAPSSVSRHRTYRDEDPILVVDADRHEVYFHGVRIEKLTPLMWYALVYLSKNSGRHISEAELAEGLHDLGYRRKGSASAADSRDLGSRLRRTLFDAVPDRYPSLKDLQRVLEGGGESLKLLVPAQFIPKRRVA
jgi:serine/threonine protein kinase